MAIAFAGRSLAYHHAQMPVLDEPETPARRAIDKGVDDVDELLTVDEVAALLKVSRSWVYERTRARHSDTSTRLPHIKIGKYVRFDRQAIRSFLERCRTT